MIYLEQLVLAGARYGDKNCKLVSNKVRRGRQRTEDTGV